MKNSEESWHATVRPHTFLLGALAIIVLVGIGLGARTFTTTSKPAAPARIVRIGLSLDTTKIDRWSKERDIMTQKASAAGATLTTAIADGNSQTQASQIENFISQKVDAIIIVAVDANALGTAISDAKKAGIKVIDYDRLTFKSSPDLYISFDSTKVGQIEAQYVVDAIPKSVSVPKIAFVGGSPTDNNATLVRNGAMSVLNPLIDANQAKLVYDKFTPDWNSSDAYAGIKQYLDNGGTLDAVVCSNDGMAGGVVKALKEHGLDGKVPVSGQDGDLSAIQRIVDGTQTVSAYKPGKSLADAAITAAIALTEGKAATSNGTTDNQTTQVSSYLLDPVAVTKSNIQQTVVKDGVYTTEQVNGSTASQ